jgi:adenosylcobinamide-GDP ribazoletransferase
MAWRRPALLALAVILPLAVLYWRRRIGGITGDGLGASMEIIETLLLMVLVAS